MSFFMQFMARIANTVVDRDTSVPRKEAIFEGVVMTSILFDEVSKHESLAIFATLGGLGEPIQEFIREQLADGVVDNWEQVIGAASARYLGISPSSLQPYATATLVPNIISPFHLACQALCSEYVSSLDSIKLIAAQGESEDGGGGFGSPLGILE
jgi:hypothetical protein